MLDEDKELFVKLREDFQEIVSNKQLLRQSTSRFLTTLIDELTLGIIFDMHRKAKTGAFDLDGDERGIETEKGYDIEIFSRNDVPNPPACLCTYCNRTIGIKPFPAHLLKCISRPGRINNKTTKETSNDDIIDQENIDRESSASDNENDADWTSASKKPIRKKRGRNGRKRSKGTPRKNGERCFVNTDINTMEADADISNLRELSQNCSNCSSPAESVCSNRSGSSNGKRGRSKGKRNRPL